MPRIRVLSAISWLLVAGIVMSAQSKSPALTTPTDQISALASLAGIVGSEIATGHIPGAVILVGRGDEIIYRQAFGLRTATPKAVPMTADTIFDLASLTKVVATTTAVMQLVDRGDIELDKPASRYWPAFGRMGKQTITIRDLLTHYSGLPADLNLTHDWTGYRTAMTLLTAERPLHPSGTRYIYSDENFEVLGEIVRRVTAMPLDRYCDEHIFKPLGMHDTRFRPVPSESGRVAPTSAAVERPPSQIVVNDPTAGRMGGVAGHAGLFSTADDLAVFATMLSGGRKPGRVNILSSASIAMMTRPASPPHGERVRGLGWDLAPPMGATNDAADTYSYGHTGYTGTMMWIDPASHVYVIVLSNRTYPRGGGDAQPLRAAVLQEVAHFVSELREHPTLAVQNQ